MGDDLVTDGVLPVGNITVDDDDPNTVESDDFLDDPEDVLHQDIVDVSIAAVADDDEDDELLEYE